MKEIVLSQEEISAIVKELAAKLTEDLAHEAKPPVFICVMKGALPFFADLTKELKFDIICDYVQLTSYDGGTESTGQVRMDKDLSINLDGRAVIIVEDIVDSGISMEYLKRHILSRFHPTKIAICALFDKYVTRKVDVEVDYAGKKLDKAQFLVGYGLDYRQLLRNIPYVFVPDEDEIKAWDALS